MDILPERATDFDPDDTVSSVVKSYRLVERLLERDSATVTELSEEMDLTKGGVYKHLNTLRQLGFVTRERGEYTVGLKYLQLGGNLRTKYPGWTTIKRKTRTLADRTGEGAVFMVEDDGKAVTLFRETGSQGFQTRTRVGTRHPIHQMAGGKAILSQLPESEVREILDSVDLSSATEQTITSRAELFEQLETIRERGYAVNREESTEGVVAVAVPVDLPDELGACSVTGPKYRLTDDEITSTVSETLLQIANEIEVELTYSSDR